MPVLQGNVSVAAGATNTNVISGSVFEYAPWNCVGRLAFTADAAGESRLTVQAGQRTVMEESPVSRANRMPLLPDDTTISKFAVRRGERIVLKVRNTGVGANTSFWNLELRPV